MTGAVNVGASKSDGDTMAILVVDDDTDYAELTATYLEQDGPFDVNTLYGGINAIDSLTGDSKPDCIVSDHDMPGMNGLEFLAAVRETHPDLPFILFTGKGTKRSRAKPSVPGSRTT